MSKIGDKISVVVPVYYGEVFLEELCLRVERAVLSCAASCEIILVNDASPDGSWRLIQKLCAAYPFVKGVNLSRNFGQHYAITAGLTYVTGDWVVVMDCDLQDVPEEIPNLYRSAVETDSDTVFARRMNRQDRLLKRLSSKAFAAIYGYLTDSKLDSSIANYGIFRRKVIDSVLRLPESIRNFPLFVRWVGYRQTAIPVTHAARSEGKSSYTLGKLMRLAFDTILTFSDKPLRIMVTAGLAISLMAFVVFIVFLLMGIFGRFGVLGYASMIVSIWFLAGVQIFFLGMVGVYVSKTFNQTKGRPVFIVSETVGFDENSENAQSDSGEVDSGEAVR